jgi:hypothetical protein
MAPPVDSATHCERDDAPANCGIEITEEMISVGASVILGEVGGARDIGTRFSADDLARRFYLAMVCCAVGHVSPES